MKIKRIGSGYYVITDSNGIEWDVTLRDNEYSAGTYWLATDQTGGYAEAATLREIKKALA